MNKLKYNIITKRVNANFEKKIKKNTLLIYDVDYKQHKPFEKISNKSNKYIFKCFNIANKLIKDKKISGFINCPISKETLFKNKNLGVTEFLSKKASRSGKEVMLIYNKKLSVSPLTTHIPLKKVSGKITKSKIKNKIETINNFYKKTFNKKPKFAVLFLNPNIFSPEKNS